MKRIEIELPFSGFDNTVHDYDIERAIENGFNYDYESGEDKEVPTDIWMADINYSAILKEYAEAYVNAFGKEFDLDLAFVEMTSPREYNFKTDRIFCTVPLEQINKIRKEVEAHKDWPQYIKDNYTSYDGFWSNFSSDYQNKDWTADLLEPVQYSTILKFWLNEKAGKYGSWRELCWEMTQDFYMDEWASVNEAHKVIEKHLKELEAK